MSTIAAIKERRSVRTYTGEPLSKEHAEQIENFIAELKPPFDAEARIGMIKSKPDFEPTRLGTYGYIKGACDFLVLILKDEPMSLVGAAYMFEQTVLFCTNLGLGTCWLGGSFRRNDFYSQTTIAEGEMLKIVSPVGYISDKTRFVERLIIGAERNHNSRKPFGSIFFQDSFSTPLSEAAAGIYAKPLEMVRLAPSANNIQSWRVVYDSDVLHFYRSFSYGFSSIDIGIALCHFEQSCIELGIKGSYKILDNAPKNNRVQYVMSFVPE